MATSALNSRIKRATPLVKSSESGDDSSYSTRRTASRRYRSLSRFSHRMPDPDAEVTPMRKGKFVNTVRGSGFAEISLDDLAVEFFDSFSAESSGETGRSGSRNSGNSEGELTHSQRRGRSVSRVGPGGSRRLDADTESSRRRRSLSRQPASRGKPGNSGGSVRVDPGSNNSIWRRSVSRQPRENSENAIRGRAIGADRENANLRRRRSLSVVSRRIDNSECDIDQLLQYSSNSRGVKSQNGGSHKPAISGHSRRSFSQNTIKYHDGYSSHSSAITDDEGKDSSSSKHTAEKIIRTVHAQNKATPKGRESFGNSDYGSQQKPHDGHHAIPTVKKGYATKLQEFEEGKLDLLAEIMLEKQHGSVDLKELLAENSSEANKKPLRMRKRSKDRSSRMSMCLTDEAEQYIDEFISNIEDTDFSSLEDERSESSSSWLIKTQSTQSVPVEMDGVMLPWLQWETPEDTCAPLASPNTKPYVWESDPTQGTSSIGTISSRGSWSPCDSAKRPVNPMRRLKIDVGEYLKRPNSAHILNETWKLRHRISSGSLVLCSRSLI